MSEDEMIEAPPERGSGRTPEGSDASRRNALRDGCRSRVVFPPEMAARIDEREARLTEKLQPDGELESMLVREIARVGVQMDVSHEQMLDDNIRVSEKTDAEWRDDRTREAARLGARLASNPCQVAGHLEDTLQGATWKLERWRLLADEAGENQGLDEPQRQLCFDLLGVPRECRRGTSRVPAGNNVAGIKALCAREVKRIETRVVLELEGRDKRARAMARLGLPMAANDTVTRRIKSNASRAHKRLTWAVDTFRSLRVGVSPATIIDPETGQPLQAAAAAAAAAPEQSQPPPQAASAPPAPRPASPDDEPIPLPDHASDEDKEMLLLVSATLRSFLRAGLVKPPDSAGPQADRSSQGE
jgi:hypothetical protein